MHILRVGVVYPTYTTWPQHYKRTSPSNNPVHDVYARLCQILQLSKSSTSSPTDAQELPWSKALHSLLQFEAVLGKNVYDHAHTK